MKERAIIFGCGYRGKRYFDKLNLDFDVVAFADNNRALWGGELFGKPIIPPSEIRDWGAPAVFVCAKDGGIEIAKQLEAMGIPCIIDMEGLCFEYRDTILYPASLRRPAPYKKIGGEYSVLYVQDAPCGRTDKVSSVLKAKGVVTQNAYFIAPSKMPEAYCKENAFYTFDDLLDFVNESEFDIVHSSNEPDILTDLLLHSNKPVVYDAHDIMSIRDRDITAETDYLEYAANRFADGHFCAEEESVVILTGKYGFPRERSTVVYNLPLESQVPGTVRRKPKLSAADGELHLVYEGGISGERESNRFMEEMWGAIAKAGVHVHYYSHQNIDYCKALERTSPYLHYEGNLSSLALITEMTQYDVGSILLNPVNVNAKIAYPNKLYEYLAAGLPVVSNLTASLEFVKSRMIGGGLDFQGDIQAQLRSIAAIQIPERYLQKNRLTMDSYADDILAFYRKISGLGKAVEG